MFEFKKRNDNPDSANNTDGIVKNKDKSSKLTQYFIRVNNSKYGPTKVNVGMEHLFPEPTWKRLTRSELKEYGIKE